MLIRFQTYFEWSHLYLQNFQKAKLSYHDMWRKSGLTTLLENLHWNVHWKTPILANLKKTPPSPSPPNTIQNKGDNDTSHFHPLECNASGMAHWQRIGLPNAWDMRHAFDPWVRTISWRRKWQPTPVFLPGKSHGQRSLVGRGGWKRVRDDWTHTEFNAFKFCFKSEINTKYKWFHHKTYFMLFHFYQCDTF